MLILIQGEFFYSYNQKQIQKIMIHFINIGHYIMNQAKKMLDKEQTIQLKSQKIIQNPTSNIVLNQSEVKYTPKIFPIAKIKFSYKINNEQLIKEQALNKNIKQILKGQFQSKQQINKKYILVLCTGNSCRSQMVQAYLKKFLQEKVQVKSAGVQIHGVNPKTIQVLAEDGIDISHNTSNHVNEYRDIPFDYVITVCDNAKQTCPYFPSKAIRIHHTFSDPSKVEGSEQQILNSFRKVRQQICVFCKQFSEKQFQNRLDQKHKVGQILYKDDQAKKNQKQNNFLVQSEVQVFKVQSQSEPNKKISQNCTKQLQKLQNSLHGKDKNTPEQQLHIKTEKQIQKIADKKQIKVQKSESQAPSLGIQNYHIQTPKSQISFSCKNPQSQQRNIQNLFTSNKKSQVQRQIQNQNQNNASSPYNKNQNSLSTKTNVLNLFISPNLKSQSMNFNQNVLQNKKPYQKEPIVVSTQINVQDIPLFIRKAWKKQNF